ncbi:AprI/Inh family metalloprotease inhibitor [Microvirga roseola]|uniref:AprI/Inh family metalloprotease inhibitor n=1 Tax=Microvirga roseola TaxID=2883126 RepID=UPI001E47ED2A|nr:AprI/Inh family metalloprotease inhibitor [Microvirga roseola]
MRKAISLPPVALAAAALLSGCTATDGHYPRGPWYSGSVTRTYPRYSAPWGQPPVVTAVEEEVVVSPIPVAVPAGAIRPAGPHRLVDRSGPLPFEPVPTPFPPPYGAMAAIDPSAIGVAPPPGDVGQVVGPIPSASQGSPVVSAPRHASSYAGIWKAVDDKGSACKVQLSSTPVLDLYKASASGCRNSALASVNAWTFGDNNVVLYSRGRVIARMSGAEAALAGTLSGSDGAVTMTR